MMPRLNAMLCAMFCVMVAVPPLRVAAQSLAQAPPGFAPELQPLAFLADSCWEGPLPAAVGASLGAGVVSHCFRWIMNGQILRDSVGVERTSSASPRGETRYYWDPQARVLRYIFWSGDGSYSSGTVRSAAGTLIFDDEQLYTSKRIVRYKTTWTQAGPDSFVQVRRREAAGGQWSNDPPGTFNRKP